MVSTSKLVFSEQLPSPKRRIASEFNFSIGVSLVVVTLLLFNFSYRSSVLTRDAATESSPSPSSSLSWLISFSSAVNVDVGYGNASEYNDTKLVQYAVVNSSDYLMSNGTSFEVRTSVREKNFIEDRFGVSRINIDYNNTSSDENGVVESDVDVAVGNPSMGGMVVLNHSYDANSGVVRSDITGTGIKGKIMVNSSRDMNGGVPLSGNGNSSFEREFTTNSGDVNSGGGVMFDGNVEGRNPPLMNFPSNKRVSTRGSYVDDSHDDCDMFDGRWLRDDSKPYYPAGSCPYIDRAFNCHFNGRPDDAYVKWRWQPYGCDLPRLNANDFLRRLRGKRLVFVGDSLNRNMWESLVCILRHSIREKNRVHEVSGRREFKKKGFYAFRFEDYNCSVDFVSAPFLVRESSFKRWNASFETLRLDLMDRTTTMYHDAEVIVFNTGHWWTHEKTSKGENYYQEGKYVHPRLKVLEAYKRALKTWANWIDQNIDTNHTQVFFRGYSVAHFRGGLWNSGGQCHKEDQPIFNKTYLAKYPSKMRVLEQVLLEMKVPVTYLNISRLTSYRKDGHPSIYRMIYKLEKEQKDAERSQDCSHWCLPGVPDIWNELLYASLLKSGWARGEIR